MSNSKGNITKKNDLLFGPYSKETNPVKILVSKDLLVLDVTADALDLFKKPRQKIINSSIVELFSELDPLSKFNIQNDTTFNLNIEKKQLSVDITKFHSCLLVTLSPVNDLFSLLRTYITSIINNLPGAVYWKDVDGRYMGCNKFVATMAGYDNPEEMIGKTDYDLCWKEFAKEWRLLDKKVIFDNKTLVREEHAKLADGKIITELTFKTPLKNEYNETIGIIGTSLDITELKETQNKLKKAKEAAEAADIAKTEFIANMSHDIRTPLSGVVGLGEIVKKEITDPKTKLKIHDMVQSANELLNMLNEILDIVSLDNITINDVHEETFNLRNLTKTVIDLEQAYVDLKAIKLIINIDNNIPTLLVGDQQKIHHILLNLISNAVKFTEKGHVNINIKPSEIRNDKVQVLFEVIDTGSGIPSKSLNKIFDLFYKVTPSYKGLEKGHGVGLHIVKTYVELLDGEIDVISKLNQGSKFSFSLTLKVANENAIPQNINQNPIFVQNQTLSPTPELPECSLTDIIPNAPEILIIEDNKIARMVAKSIIKEVHCNPTTAHDAESGLELAKSKNFNLILTDIGLPGISGVEFAKNIRAYEKKCKAQPIPIIALTGHAERKLHDECINAGINEILIKPIRAEVITKVFTKFSILTNKNIQSPEIEKSNISNALENKQDLPESEDALFEINDIIIFDIMGAKKIVGENNSELIMQLLKETICTTIPQELPRLKAAHDKENWQDIADISHKLKGGFLSIGLTRAATACKYLERYHKSGETMLLEKLYQQLLNTLEATTNRLKGFVS